MTEYRIVTLWRNIAKIAALSIAAVVVAYWAGGSYPVVFLVGAASPLIGARIWGTHELRTTPNTTGGGDG